jgi:hypothetical protein
LLGEPGALVLARYRAPANRPDPSPPTAGRVIGSQLGITLQPMPQLAGETPVIGKCKDLDVVLALSRTRDAPKLERVEVIEDAE